MAIVIVASNNFIEVALDGATNFDVTTDLVNLGLARDAPDGIRVRKITFVPSNAGDGVVVRDGVGGPAMFTAQNVLGTYDILKDEYRDSRAPERGKLVKPYIDAAECTVTTPGSAFVIFEL